MNYLLKGSTTPVRRPRNGAAVTVLVLYFLLLCSMAISYARLVHTVLLNPGYVPRGSNWSQHHEKRSRNRGSLKGTSLEKPNPPSRSERYPDGSERTDTPKNDSHPMQDMQPSDFPVSNLAEFYAKEVFVCEQDARPPWCSSCLIFKPDRTHHCSEVDRCVRKMDHFCPW